MLIIPDLINVTRHFNGLDSLELCYDREHWLNYNKKITYKYNSRGFRDDEWPEDLSNVIWCVGDSFTVGTGQPFDEIWPRLLQTKIGKRCLNISQEGMSNDTIALMIHEIVNTYAPKNVVVMWSYLHRRKVNNIDVHHNKKDFGDKQDLENFCKNYESVEKLPTNIIHTLVPYAFKHFGKHVRNFTKYAIDKQLSKKTGIIECKQLDRARDGNHFDIKTSELITTEIVKLLENTSK